MKNFKKSFSNKITTSRKAFSLIELSIVILIIGLIVVGVIGGRKLITMSNLSKARALTNSSPVAGIEGLSMWFETTSRNSLLSGEAIDGIAVSTWRDINPQLTNKKDVSATLTARPTYSDNAANGLPALSFNGTSNVLTRANTSGYELGGTNEATIFAVSKWVSPTSPGAIVDWRDSGNLNRMQLTGPWSSVLYWDYGDQCCGANRISVSVPADFMDKWNVMSAIKRADSTGDISVNNTAIVTSSSISAQFTAPSSTSTLFLGSSFDGGLHKGYIAEFILYNRALSSAERLEVTKYLSKKWGIAIN